MCHKDAEKVVMALALEASQKVSSSQALIHLIEGWDRLYREDGVCDSVVLDAGRLRRTLVAGFVCAREGWK